MSNQENLTNLQKNGDNQKGTEAVDLEGVGYTNMQNITIRDQNQPNRLTESN